MRLTESSSAFFGSMASGDRACRRRSEATVWRLCVARDRGEQLLFLLAERRVAIADQLADLAALGAERQPRSVLPRSAFRLGDPTVLEDERGAGSADGVHRRLDDRLERLLEIEGVGHRFGDAREGLELADPALSLRIQAGVLDRLRHLAGDREQQLDLPIREHARFPRAHVEGALELVAAGHDRYRQDRLVLVLGQVRERLEAWIEVRLRRQHDRLAFDRRSAGDPLAGAHPGPAGHLLDARPVRGPQHELAAPLVIEVDEAGVGVQCVGHLARDQGENLLEVERRVDRRNRLGQQAEMPFGGVHVPV
jgi:hypothetical protein